VFGGQPFKARAAGRLHAAPDSRFGAVAGPVDWEGWDIEQNSSDPHLTFGQLHVIQIGLGSFSA
jgi:hypothetical protein